ncbi:hypothetical protein DPMN_160824 [Dreissena polymorpha]|uniref:Uncharacterized protein n=1 Tax=Dreissena polymorpha TaxID=45954 RepID=A0A9D4IQH8_DREPO|nr:hypothetical protein DPMN_160824 [Dreissena polymorpha]
MNRESPGMADNDRRGTVNNRDCTENNRDGTVAPPGPKQTPAYYGEPGECRQRPGIATVRNPSRLFPMQSRLFPVPSRSLSVTLGSSRRY